MSLRRLVSSSIVCLSFHVSMDTQSLQAQQTPADTAAVILEVARQLRVEGATTTAEELLEYLIQRYPGSPAATQARELLADLLGTLEERDGRVQFIVWNTLFFTWLGLATPAALGADEPEPFGAGLLIGAPVGYLASRAFASNRPISSGQAGAYTLSTIWGTWQAMGWRAVLNIGEKEICNEFGCYSDTPTEAPWTAAVVGGLAGIGTGLWLSKKNIPRGDMTLVDHGALWGTYYGLALGIILNKEDDTLLAYTLLGGNAGLLAAVPAARAWRPTRGQVRLASVAGLAGGVAGLGIDLIVQPDDTETAVAIPTATATIGLIVGALTVRGKGRPDGRSSPDFQQAFLNVGDDVTVGFPLPFASALPSLDEHGRRRLRPALSVNLVSARF
jgi:hypothetical protein